MKVILALAANKWFSPYLRIYTNLLDKNNIDYDIVFWNRDKSENEPISFVANFDADTRINKIRAYIQYVKFISKCVRRGNYDKIIVFSSQLSICLSHLLLGEFRDNYMIDFRDLSVEQNSIFKRWYSVLLNNSCLNVISSPGFVEYLPKNINYVLSHNFDIDLVRQTICREEKMPSFGEINILTIGGIRDYGSNIEVVKALANKKPFNLQFVGKGEAVDKIKQYVKQYGISNVTFLGYYDKKDEPDFVKKAHFINIYYPMRPSHNSALSNRFYNSLIFKRPMIVTKNTVQGDFVDKYNLGLSLNSCEKLDEKINSFISNYNHTDFCSRANCLLETFISDYQDFEDELIKFVCK